MAFFRVPVATYRIQFSLTFRFTDARDLVPYLHELGVTDLYASPRFKARKGSSHGYDVADPLRVNSELGTEEEFDELVERLKQYGMGLILDIVPNHMAASPENPWWMDVLENGESSRYASYFDIDWHPATTNAAFLRENKILLPVLGSLYGSALENQELALKLDERGLFVSYYEARLPLDPKSYRLILQDVRDRLREASEPSSQTVEGVSALLAKIDRLPDRFSKLPEDLKTRRGEKEAIKQDLWRLYQSDHELHRILDQSLDALNGARGDQQSFDRLDEVLSEQAYRLAYWKMAAEEINYRRFFDVSDLVGLRLEEPEVFEARHSLIVQLVREGKVTGLRVDHIDGIYDPLGYLRQLQAAVTAQATERPERPAFYIVVEKVLGGDEPLPQDWPACGTTGYDFLNAANGVFIEPQGLLALEADYQRFTGCADSFADACYTRNKQVMEQLFQGEVNALAHRLRRLAAQDRHARDLPHSELTQALVEVTACLPVYRTYIRSFDVSSRDRLYVERALKGVRQRTSREQVSSATLDFLRCVLLLDPPYYTSEDQKQEWLSFVMRWQQFAGPVMAKGLEDTAYYVHNSLLSLNEVGGDPLRQNLPFDLEAFHLFNQQRLSRWPYTLNATSTHDTKRSEDVRARINVLSELPEQWEGCLRRWSRWNLAKKQMIRGRPVPDSSEEVHLYQCMLGAWPLEDDEEPCFKERVQAYMMKAVREAKVHTSWMSPNAEYENALSQFLESILEASGTNRFLQDFKIFQETVAHFGAFNSLSELLLKIASPGVPDFYQGTELWNFSLVDPDNRRPVDFRMRARLLDDLRRQEHDGLLGLVRDLVAHRRDGRIKLYTAWKALQFRRVHEECFLEGDYIPLYASGKRIENVCAFLRRKGDHWSLVAAPRLMTKLMKADALPLGLEVWGTGTLPLPTEAPRSWANVFTGESIKVAGEQKKSALRLQRIFQSFPVALLAGGAD